MAFSFPSALLPNGPRPRGGHGGCLLGARSQLKSAESVAQEDCDRNDWPPAASERRGQRARGPEGEGGLARMVERPLRLQR